MGIADALRAALRGPDPTTIAALDLRGKAAPLPGGVGAYGSASNRLASWSSLLPSTKIDYTVEAGDPALNAVVMACVNWIARTFPEAPLRVMRRGEPGGTALPDHPLTQLLARPNPAYNGLLLMSATLANFNISGNAYWLKVYNKARRLTELWWEPDYSCKPYWDSEGPNVVDGYMVLRNGQWLVVPGGPTAVVHYRNRLDPRNPRLGISPLAAALREIFTDNEAANFTAGLVRNMGIPGLIVSPATPDTTIDDPKGLKAALIANFGGDRRGEPMVMAGPTKVDTLGFSPADLNLELVRNIPEERICALIGIPPIVAGLGTGLDHATFANYKQAVEAAYHHNILPTQALLAAQQTSDLIPEFGDSAREYVEFDTSMVEALAEDRDALYKRVALAWSTGLITRAEGRTALDAGYVSTPDDEIFSTDLVRRAERITEVEPAGTLIPDLGPEGEPIGKSPAPSRHGRGTSPAA